MMVEGSLIGVTSISTRLVGSKGFEMKHAGFEVGCPFCGAWPSNNQGAFGAASCGYPLADCPSIQDEAEAEAEDAEFEAFIKTMRFADELEECGCQICSMLASQERERWVN